MDDLLLEESELHGPYVLCDGYLENRCCEAC